MKAKTTPKTPLTVYTYSGCSTCGNALKWLRANGVDFVEKPIRETPPSVAQLQRMLVFQDGNLRRLFNTSSTDYRERGLSTKIHSIPLASALTLLATNGNLVKRPFLLADSFGLIGFNEAEWAEALA